MLQITDTASHRGFAASFGSKPTWLGELWTLRLRLELYCQTLLPAWHPSDGLAASPLHKPDLTGRHRCSTWITSHRHERPSPNFARRAITRETRSYGRRPSSSLCMRHRYLWRRIDAKDLAWAHELAMGSSAMIWPLPLPPACRVVSHLLRLHGLGGGQD